MNNLRLHWDAQEGWLLDVPTALSKPALQRVVEWSIPKQVARFQSLPPGDKKDDLKRAIESLREGKVRQRLVGTRGDGKGDLVMFQANRPQEDRKVISLGVA